MANDGIQVSSTEPEVAGKVTWLKILPNGSREWYEKNDGGWTLVESEEAPATVNHSHTELGDINFTGTISVDGDEGLTGERTVGGYTLTFKKGLLVGFQAP
uniref:Uncharacterized protein n=1 Tax=viral metagenome TaxID=1070528 RepID=A0A6M3L136_9ZZZZ